MSLVLVAFCCIAFAQRRTTSVRGYYRKDGTYVSPHTRHYNAGSSSYSGSSSSRSSSNASSEQESETPEISDSNLTVSGRYGTGGYKKAGGYSITPTAMKPDSNGVTMLLAVLRYNGTEVLDICPLQKTIVNYDYETSSTSLVFKVRKDRLKEGQVIELLSNWGFYDKDQFLGKSIYLGYGKNNLPPYLSLKIEALSLK